MTKMTKKVRELWFSQNPYKRILISPFALILYLRNGQMAPVLDVITLINKRSIFIGVQKCGISTVLRTIRRYSHYLSLNKRGLRNQKDKCFTFSFVRDPYARFLSAYMDKVKEKTGGRRYIQPEDTVFDNIKRYKDVSFEEFVRTICLIPDRCVDVHFKSISYIQDSIGVKPDFIGKMENFEEDWNKIHKILGLPSYEKLGIENRGKYKKDLDEYYTKELKNLVYGRYKEDFLRFGYKR